MSLHTPHHSSHAAKDPGRRLYILSMIAVYTFLHLPGLVLSIISWKKSKDAGYSTTNATTAIVANSVLLVFSIYFYILVAGLRLG